LARKTNEKEIAMRILNEFSKFIYKIYLGCEYDDQFREMVNTRDRSIVYFDECCYRYADKNGQNLPPSIENAIDTIDFRGLMFAYNFNYGMMKIKEDGTLKRCVMRYDVSNAEIDSVIERETMDKMLISGKTTTKRRSL